MTYGSPSVITVGALITMAAHLEGKGTSVLDFTGFAQKFGPVLSYIRIAREPAALNQVRIDDERADALIGCDLVVSSSPQASRTYGRDHTRAVLNTTEISTADFVLHRDADLNADLRINAIRDVVGGDNLSTVSANRLAAAFLGDTIYTNVLMLGFAWQHSLVPVSEKAILRAIEINAVKIDNNKQAFGIGRLAAADPEFIEEHLNTPPESIDETLDEMIERRAGFLLDYQNAELSGRYVDLLQRVREAETHVAPDGQQDLARAVARAYFKTLAYKDEYEVARLHTDTGFLEKIKQDFGTKAKIRFHLAPPMLPSTIDARGRPRKKEFGAWMILAFRVLAKMRGLRGTAFDVFGYLPERRMERALIGEFEETVSDLLAGLSADNIANAGRIVRLYNEIRGYGPVKEEAANKVRPQIKQAMFDFTNLSEKAA